MWVSVLWALVWSLVLEIKVRSLPESKINVMHGRTDRRCSFLSLQSQKLCFAAVFAAFEIAEQSRKL